MLDVFPEEGLLIRSAYLRNDIKASSLLKEARRRAKEIVAQAEEKAEKLYVEVKTDGYAAGILQAAGALLNYLVGHAELASQMQAKLQSEIGALLRHCVNNPDVIMAAFDEYLDEQGLSNDSGIDVLLPESMRSRHGSLMARLQEHVSGHLNIEYLQDQRFLFRAGDHVAEFFSDDFVKRSSVFAMNTLPSLYAENLALADKCRQQLSLLFDPVDVDISKSGCGDSTVEDE
jgi:hypothetical protein